ncbi:DUF3095 domain-containing protein [Roseibium sp.]|uniref:DUF3095 domain-containing protein n=1 Tax=Roseibium sp. TaxID=1936156 RepID=UPI003A978450
MTISSDAFYRDLAAFSDFAEVGTLRDYKPLPEDWVVLCADIVRSRDAIAAGRYKDVNFVGAAVISAVLNVVGKDDVPFVFGGDGAMLMVPASAVAAGRQALSGLQQIAADETGLQLRGAAIPVARLRSAGKDVLVRKYELSRGNYLAMVIGGGLELADQILKDETLCRPFVIEAAAVPRPDLSGLSCRWEPLPSERGRVVALIMQPQPPGAEGLARVGQQIQKIVGFDPFGSEADAAQHVTRSRLRFRFPPRNLSLETRLVAKAGNRLRFGLRTLLESLAVIVAATTGIRIGPLEPKRYFAELCRNTDHRKLDDSLRMVLDVSEQQLEALKAYLESSYRSGELVFGLHESDSALMTCFVSDISDSRHLHFIDGANGGFALAAQDFKDRQALKGAA